MRDAPIDTHDIVLREAFGIDASLPPELRLRLAKVVKAVASGDRDLSPMEGVRLLALTRAYGLTQEATEELLKWDALGAPVEPLLTADARPYARLVLHDALRVAMADGVTERERKAASLAARALRVDHELVVAVRALLTVDESVRTSRHALLHGRWPEAELLDARGAIHAAEAFRRQEYGLAGPLRADDAMALARATLALVGADGAVSAPEWSWFLGWARALGLDARELRALADEPIAKRPDLLVEHLPEPCPRLILYAALRCARADGIAPPEREAAEGMAGLLGVPPAWVPPLEGQLLLEDALRAARLRVLSSHASDGGTRRGTF